MIKLSLRLLVLLLSFFIVPLTYAESSGSSVTIPAISFLPPKSVSVELPMSFMGEDMATIAVLADQIRKAKSFGIGQITIRVQGIGGAALSANTLLRAIQAAQASGVQIDMEVIGPSYSASAFIVCAGSKVIMQPGSALMFHGVGQYSTHIFGLISYMDRGLDKTMNQWQDYMFSVCKAKGLLTAADIVNIKNGKEVVKTLVNGKLTTTVTEARDDLKSSTDQIIELILMLLGTMAVVIITAVIIKKV